MFADYHNPNDYWRHNPMMSDPNIDPDDAMKSGCFVVLFYIIALIIGAALCMLLGSCTTTKYVPVIEHKTDTLIQTKVQKDSVFLHDSTFVKVAGDTVLIERWHTVWQNHTIHDTVYKARVDSVPKPYPVIKEVEKPLSRRHKAVFTVGVLTILGVVCWFVWWVVKTLRRFGILRI